MSTNSSTPSSTASGWTSVTSTTSYSASVNYTFNTTGTITLYVWFKDEAGNVSSRAIAYIVIDSTSPLIAEVNAVITPTSDRTPEYTFSSEDALLSSI